MTRRQKSGFTLLEILITFTVLSLLAITSALAIPKQIMKSRDTQRKTDLRKIARALEEYYSVHEAYPNKLPDCGEQFTTGTNVILSSLPCDPLTESSYLYLSKSDDHQSYKIYTKLENPNDPSVELAGCQAGCGSGCVYNFGISSTNVSINRCSYVCAPGGGKTGYCELYQNYSQSSCPKNYGTDSTCKGECSVGANRCGNASGKNVPY